MNVGVQNEEKITWIRVQLSGTTEALWFKRESTTMAEANAVRVAVEHEFEERTKYIRRAAYNRGRDSMRDKSRRVVEFEGCFNNDIVGYL